MKPQYYDYLIHSHNIRNIKLYGKISIEWILRYEVVEKHYLLLDLMVLPNMNTSCMLIDFINGMISDNQILSSINEIIKYETLQIPFEKHFVFSILKFLLRHNNITIYSKLVENLVKYIAGIKDDDFIIQYLLSQDVKQCQYITKSLEITKTQELETELKNKVLSEIIDIQLKYGTEITNDILIENLFKAKIFDIEKIRITLIYKSINLAFNLKNTRSDINISNIYI